MKYSGQILEAGKAVSDAALGGMVLLSAAVVKGLPREYTHKQALLWNLGRHVLRGERMLTAQLFKVRGVLVLFQLQLKQQRMSPDISQHCVHQIQCWYCDGAHAAWCSIAAAYPAAANMPIIRVKMSARVHNCSSLLCSCKQVYQLGERIINSAQLQGLHEWWPGAGFFGGQRSSFVQDR